MRKREFNPLVGAWFIIEERIGERRVIGIERPKKRKKKKSVWSLIR